jgi:hypothetical protein
METKKSNTYEETKQMVQSLYKDSSGEPFELTDGQAELFELIFKKKYPRIHVETYTRYGKLISDDTPVLTTKGWKKHGELMVGDYVFNHKGMAVRVKAVMPKGKANLEVEFTNGEKIKCHSKHQWLVSHKEWKSKNGKRGEEYRVLETEEILNYNLDAKYNYFRVSNIKPLQFENKQLIIHPYVLGAWLGDGTFSKNCITHSEKDIAVIKKIERLNYKRTGISGNSGTITSYFKKLYGELIKEGFLVKGRGKTKKGNKIIPEKYLLSSIEQRLELLAGLIDTDGSVRNGKRGKWNDYRICFTNTNKKLIDGVIELVRGLGMRTSLTKVRAAKSSSGIEGRQDVYIVGFTPTIEIPTVLKRKKVIPIKKQRKVCIRKIKKINSVVGNCIQVDSEDGIYLIGKNHIPTHNSEVISMAVLTRVSTFAEKWAIVAEQEEKAHIIMDYVIKHIFDNEYTRQRFIVGPGEDESNIRRYRNKKRINFNIDDGKLGELFICSAKEAMGFGAQNVVEDESALVSGKNHAFVMRMLGDQTDNFLVKVGNPWQSEHFQKSFEDIKYHKFVVDYVQGIKEGRLKPEYVDEMRKQPFFDVLYECKRPKEGMADERGWVQLLTRDEIERAMTDIGIGFGVNKLGVDVAGGGRNMSVIVQRYTNLARIAHKTNDSDTMLLAETVMNLKKQEDERGQKIPPQNILIDSLGVGKGVYDLLSRNLLGVYGVNGASRPMYDEERFVNLRAEMYWRAMEWIKKGGKLMSNDDWYQLSKIKYKIKLSGTKGKLQIISKEELLKEGIQSPDVADAFAMTFATEDVVSTDASELPSTSNDYSNSDLFNPFQI